jgi:hypothetical protein
LTGILPSKVAKSKREPEVGIKPKTENPCTTEGTEEHGGVKAEEKPFSAADLH